MLYKWCCRNLRAREFKYGRIALLVKGLRKPVETICGLARVTKHRVRHQKVNSSIPNHAGYSAGFLVSVSQRFSCLHLVLSLSLACSGYFARCGGRTSQFKLIIDKPRPLSSFEYVPSRPSFPTCSAIVQLRFIQRKPLFSNACVKFTKDCSTT